MQPRRATTDYGVPASEWLLIPVPALVDTGVFAAVQEQLQDNRRHARQSRRGARYLLQGLVMSAVWLCLLRQTDQSHRGQGQDPYLRVLPVLGNGCLSLWRGTGLYQSPGADRSRPRSVAEVSGLLAHPERVAEEYQRRLQAPTSGTRQAQATLETQIGKVRQGWRG